MDDLVTFFKLLFFLKTTLITSSPITIGDEWTSVRLQEPIEVITGGAAVYVDVTRYVKPVDFEAANKRFPVDAIEGELVATDGQAVSLRSSGTSHGNDSVWVIVASAKSVPVGIDYVEVRLKIREQLEGVDVYWKNGRH